MPLALVVAVAIDEPGVSGRSLLSASTNSDSATPLIPASVPFLRPSLGVPPPAPLSFHTVPVRVRLSSARVGETPLSTSTLLSVPPTGPPVHLTLPWLL